MINGNIDVVELNGDINSVLSLEGNLLPVGPKGDKGDPGFSPVVSTSKSGKTTTIKFETATGNVFAYIQDGEDGQGSGDMLTDVYDQNKNGIVDNAEKVNNHTVLTDVPADAVFTDTLVSVNDFIAGSGIVIDEDLQNDKIAIMIDQNDIPYKSDIPTKTSVLTNDSGFIDKDVNNLTNYTKTTDLQDNLVNVGTSVDTDYRTNILITKNLFDKNNVEVINGYINSSNGNIIEGGQSNVTKTFINVKPNTTYSLTCNNVGRVAYYDGSKTFLSQIDAGDRNIFTTPANTKYIRFQYQISGGSTIDTIQLELGGQATTYEPFIQKTINVNNNKFTDTINVGTEIDSANRVNVLYSHNLLNLNVLTIGTFTYNDTGTRITTNNYIGIEFITTKPNTNYTFNATLPSQYTSLRYVQFDSSKTFISRSNAVYFSNGIASFTTGNNCYYIAILCYKTTTNASTSDLVNPMLNEGSTALSYEPYLTPSINVDGEEIYSKPVILWENPSPTSEFASQNIQMPSDFLTTYKYYEITYFSGTNKARAFSTGKIAVGSGTNLRYDVALEDNVYPAIRYREINYNSTNIVLGFANARQKAYNSTTGTTSNGSCIPYQIIGYKQ